MSWVLMLISVILLGTSGLVLLQRLRVYSVLLLLLSFFGLSLMFSYSEMSLAAKNIADKAVIVFALGTVELLVSLVVFEGLFYGLLQRSRETWAWRFDNYTLQHLIYSGFFLTVSLGIFLIFRSDYNSTWEDARHETVIMLAISPFLMFLGSPGLVSAWRIGKGVFFVYLIVTISVFTLSGSRAGVLSALAMYVWYWMADNRRTKFNWRIVISLTLICTAVFAAHAVLRGLRSFSPADVVAMFFEGDLGGIANATAEGYADGGIAGSESAIAKYFVFSVSAADESIYGFLTSVVRACTLFMPGTFFPDKPIDVSYRLWEDAFISGLFDDSPYYQALATDYAAGVMGSLHPTFFGELFLAGEWVGLLIGVIFFSSLCMLIEILLLKMQPVNALLLLGPTLVGMAMIARGNSVIGVGYFFYLLPIVLLTSSSMSKFSKLFSVKRG